LIEHQVRPLEAAQLVHDIRTSVGANQSHRGIAPSLQREQVESARGSPLPPLCTGRETFASSGSSKVWLLLRVPPELTAFAWAAPALSPCCGRRAYNARQS